MFILYKVHYLYFLLILFQISLIKSEQPYDIKTSILNHISDCNSRNEKDRLKLLSEIGGIFRSGGEYRIQISFFGNQNYTNSNGIKYPQVKFTEDCKNTILGKYFNSTDVVVTKLFKSYQLDENSNNYKAGITELTDVLYYQFFPFINNKIDKDQPIDIGSVCSEDVVIYGPLYIDEFLKNKFVAVAGQNPETKIQYLRNYDIFDPNAKIYTDICYPITFSYAAESIITKDSFKNYDISLQQRRKYYFPGNLELCPTECSYLGTDKDTVSTMCKCKFNKTYTLTGNDITVHTSYSNFNFNEKKFNTTKKDNYLTIESFKCVKLPFSKSGFKGNYGSILMIAIICIVFLSYLILIISGKYHLLSVLELLYNSNIKSMNYIKNPYSPSTNVQNQIQYDARSNNLLLNSQRGVATNGLMMSSILTGNNFISGINYTYNKVNPIQVGKKSNNSKNSGVQIVSKNTLNKAKKEKNNLINVDEIQENEYESERNSIGNNKTGINSMNKNKTELTNKKEEPKKEQPIKIEPKKEELKKEESEDEPEEEEISSIDKSKRQNSSRNNIDNQNKSQNKSNIQNKSNVQNDNNKSKQENKDEEEDEESDEEDEDNDSKANPPKKKHGTNRPSENGKENGNEKEETKKKKKEKQPIEIALNVKDLREMMFNTMLNKQKSNENGKSKSPAPQQNSPPQNNNNNPLQNNGFMNPYMNPLSFFPPPFPGYNYNNNNSNNNNNEDAIRREYENKARQRELEFQRELSDLRERERQRQRDLDYERERRQRDDLYRDRNYDKDRYDKNDELEKEKERLNKQNQEIQKMREKLQKEYDEKQYKDRERDLEMEKELSRQRDLQKQKELEYEKELLRQKESLKEQFEKEKKEIIEKKDKEIQNLREEKDREIQRLKEDKEREIKNMKEDFDREKRSQDEKIKKKEKEFKKEKQKMKEMQKLTSNSFFMNGINANSTMQQQIIDINNDLNRFEKIDTPQIVVPMDSIFTDQELNAMDYENSYQYDKRTLCQVYLSYINRKQPLFFLFNYNSSSSGSISTFQINYQSVKFIIFCVELMIYMFFYATFFGSKSITYILQGKFNSRRRCTFAIILSPFCMIAKSVIHHFVYDNINMKIAEIKMRCYNNFLVGRKPEEVKVNEFKDFWESEGENQKNNVKEEKKEEIEDIQEIEDDNLPEEEKMRRKDKYEKRKLKSLIKDLIAIFRRRVFISFGIMIFVMFIMWYYISAFCAVYKNSQLTFFINILISYGFSNLIPFVYCIVPTVFKLEAIKEESKFIFFLGQISQII